MEPLLDNLHDEQEWMWSKEKIQKRTSTFAWTPSKIIERLGKEIDNEDSIIYWAYKNEIPVFCPTFTDGSIGDQLFFHSYKRPGFVVDVVSDARELKDLAVNSHATGMICIGGGSVKQTMCRANLMRDGADFAVFLDSETSLEEERSRGTIRSTDDAVKLDVSSTIAFPLIVSQTFGKEMNEWEEQKKDSVCWVHDIKAE